MSLALCFRYQQADASDTDARERNVLRISITETPTETRWILQGRLSGPWASELSAIWRTSTRTRKGRTCLVDLNDITFIDKDAGDLLRTMSREGAEFIADGLYIKQVFEGLKISRKRGLSGMVSSFFAARVRPLTRLGSEVGKINAKYDARTLVNSGNRTHAPSSTTPPFNGKEDQNYGS
jgi:hypothetical protein